MSQETQNLLQNLVYKNALLNSLRTDIYINTIVLYNKSDDEISIYMELPNISFVSQNISNFSTDVALAMVQSAITNWVLENELDNRGNPEEIHSIMFTTPYIADLSEYQIDFFRNPSWE